MVGIFKANNPANTFLLFGYGILLKFAWFSVLPAPVTKKTDGILYTDFILALQKISNDSAVLYVCISYFLLFTQAVWFNKIVNSQHLTQRPTYLPAMSYLLVTSMFPDWNTISSALIVNTLLIWLWLKINGLNNNQHPKAALFNAGMLIGISALFYFPSFAFALLIVFALILNRPFNITEWIIALIGILTPYYYLFVLLFLSDNLASYKLPLLVFSYPGFRENYWQWASILLILITFVTGAYFVQLNFRKQIVQIRKSWSLMLFYLIVSAGIPFLSDTRSFQNWVVTAVPLSAFMAGAFLYPSKKWLPRLLHWLMVAFAIAISYYKK